MTDRPQGWTAERLLELLPALWRVRDTAPTGGASAHAAGLAPGGGGALAGLLTVLADVADALELDLEELRDDWFIETCADWAVPYIGDLVSAAPMHDAGGLVDLRAWVADTVALRRRLGTLAAIEAVGRAVTGYPTVAVETRTLLGWHQHLAHVREARTAFISVSGPTTAIAGGTGGLDHVDGAFDSAPRFVDVRTIGGRARRGPAGTDGDGHHNLPTVALHAWQVATERLETVTLTPASDPSDGRYRVHPLGLEEPLRRFARPEVDVEHLAGEEDVPSVIRRRWLHEVLHARHVAAAGGEAPPEDAFASDPPFRVRWRAAPGAPLEEIPPERMVACHLDDPAAPLPTGWRRPPSSIDVAPAGGTATVNLPIRVGIDPANGRVAFPAGVAVDHVEMDLAEPSVAEIGAGAHARDDDLDSRLADRPVGWQAAVSVHDPTAHATLAAAVAAWHAQPDGTVGMITVLDSHRYVEDLTGAGRIRIGPNSRLLLVGAQWPVLPVPGGAPGETARRLGVVDASAVRPVLVGDLDVTGAVGTAEDLPGELVLHGLFVTGRVSVVATAGGDLGALEVAHSTVVDGVRVTSANDRLSLDLTRVIAGPVSVPVPVRTVTAVDSVVRAESGPSSPAVSAVEAPVTLERSTVTGRVRAEVLQASDCVLLGEVHATRRQVGCVRYSWVAPGSITPRRFRCQPDLAIEPLEEAGAGPAALASVVARLTPSFVSDEVGNPALGLLLAGTPDAVRRASSTAGEPGAHAHLHRPHREDNLRRALEEHLPLGLEAGLIDPGRHLP